MVVQGIGNQDISAKITTVAAIKGGIVGAANELSGSATVTSAVAGAAGYVDGMVSALAAGSDPHSANLVGGFVASGDASAAYVGTKFGDAYGAGVTVTLSTLGTKVPGVASALRDAAGDAAGSMSTQIDVLSSQITDVLQKAQGGGTYREYYSELEENSE